MATYYISTTGSDTTGSGNTIYPWATLEKAISSSLENDTIMVSGGTYYIGSGSTLYDGIYFSGSRTIQGEGSDVTFFDYTYTVVLYIFFFNNNITIKDMCIRNIIIPWIDGGTMVCCETGSIILLERVIFDTIKITGYSTYSGFLGGRHSAPPSNFNLTLKSCVFKNIYGSCVTNTIGSNNTINIYNCVYYKDNSEAQLSIIGTSTNYGTNNITNIKNCVFFNNSGQIVDLYYSYYGNFPAPFLTYSCQYGLTNTVSGSTNIFVDPLFVDPSNSNFHLQVSSPCRNIGTII